MTKAPSRGGHASGRPLVVAALAALTSWPLAAQPPAPAILVVREPIQITREQDAALAEVTGDLFPGHHVQVLPGITSERRADPGLSFPDAWDIARGNQSVLQAVRYRECARVEGASCGAELPVRARQALDWYDDLAGQTLDQLAQALRQAGDAGIDATIVFVSSGLPFRVEPRRGLEAVGRAARESGGRLIVVDVRSEGRGTMGLTRLIEVTRAERFGVSPEDRSRLRARLAVPSTPDDASRPASPGGSARARSARPLPAAARVAMQHAVAFAEKGASVLADERTVQEVRVRPSHSALSPGSDAGITIEKRVLDSEVALVHVGNAELWLLARDVLRVDGKDVPDAERVRLPSVHPASTPDALRQFEQIAQQGARFNIGGIERNVNTPTLALWLLTPAASPRLDFSDGGTARVDGRLCDVIAFRERGAPYFFVVAGEPAPVSGRLWVDRGRAAVVKTELSLPGRAVQWTPSRATVSVTYALDPALSAWVPRAMTERYDSYSSRQFVVAQSTYTNFRMFTVGARIVK